MNVNHDYLAEALIQFDLIVANKDLSLSEAIVQLNIVFNNTLNLFSNDLKQILYGEFKSLLAHSEESVAKRER